MLRLPARIANWLAAFALLGMALLTLLDVLGRNLFRAPVPGATELTEIGLVAVTFLLYPQIAARQTHITVDLLDDFFTPAMRRALGVVGSLLGAAVFAILAWQLWILGARLTSYGDVTSFLRIPLGPVIQFMAVMSAVTVAGFLVAARACARGRTHGADMGAFDRMEDV